MSLVVNNLWKSYPHGKGVEHVLRDISLTVEPGQFVSLIGQSGGGKSTLLNAMGGKGLVVGESGGLTLDSDPITGPGPDRAMVFQSCSLLPRLSLVRNVEMAVKSARRDWSNERITSATEHYLTAVGLWAHKDKSPIRCRAACSNAAPWLGPSPWNLERSCSTNRAVRSMPSPAADCKATSWNCGRATPPPRWW